VVVRYSRFESLLYALQNTFKTSPSSAASICRGCGIELREDSSLKIGSIRYEDGVPIISYRPIDKKADNFRVFILVGILTLLYHKVDKSDCVSSFLSRADLNEAVKFAAAITMPKIEFLKKAVVLKKDVKALSDYFNVPEDLITRRLNGLLK
jgi:hypothetical protein